MRDWLMMALLLGILALVTYYKVRRDMKRYR